MAKKRKKKKKVIVEMHNETDLRVFRGSVASSDSTDLWTEPAGVSYYPNNGTYGDKPKKKRITRSQLKKLNKSMKALRSR